MVNHARAGTADAGRGLAARTGRLQTWTSRESPSQTCSTLRHSLPCCRPTSQGQVATSGPRAALRALFLTNACESIQTYAIAALAGSGPGSGRSPNFSAVLRVNCGRGRGFRETNQLRSGTLIQISVAM
jgi:hypothetical protein